MIYWLFQTFKPSSQLILRVSGAALVSFAIVMIASPKMIRMLIRKKLGDRPEFDHASLNELTKHKSNTPTMGGMVIVAAIFLSVVLFANLRNMYISMGLLALVWLGVLGGIDDWLKLRRAAGSGTRDGLKSWEKILFQIGLAVLLSIFIYKYGEGAVVPDPSAAWPNKVVQQVNPSHSFYLPLKSAPIALPLAMYVFITALTMVGACNAVNLTDGMDGLAAGSLLSVTSVLLVLSLVVGTDNWAYFFNMPLVKGSQEMMIFCGAMLGACLGFLWYNAHPAQVFMGDTGSLPLGGLLGYIAVVTRQELLLMIAGGVLVMEAGSVILQVGYFKLTKPAHGMQGKRLFRCAPLHHHFHLGGWAESKVVIRFWVMGLIFGALALATLKLR